MTGQVWSDTQVIEHLNVEKRILEQALRRWENECNGLKARIAELEAWNYALIERCATAELAAQGRWEPLPNGEHSGIMVNGNAVYKVYDFAEHNVTLPDDIRLCRRVEAQEAS